MRLELNLLIYFPFIHCVRRRKDALPIRIGVKIVWDDVDSVNGWILGRASGISRRFFFFSFCGGGGGGEDNISNEREPGIEIIERTP